jgi:hypothetical protein
MDLITDSWGDRRLILLHGIGHGRWESPGTPIDAGWGPYVNVIATDLTGDGRPDLAFPNAMPSSPRPFVSVLLGDGRGGFTPAAQSPIPAGPAPFMIAAGDVNGDGRPDLLVANYSGHISDTSHDGVTWIRNDGDGRFTAFPERVMVGHGSWSIAAGDVNGDGFVDAAFINAAQNTISIAYGSRDGLRAGGEVTVMDTPHRIAVADLRSDGRASILVTTEQLDEIRILSLRRP